MDPLTSTIAAVGLTLAIAGTAALLAWRYRRTSARIPAVLLALAVAVMAFPTLIQVAGQAIDATPADATDATEHPADAVVSPEQVLRR